MTAFTHRLAALRFVVSLTSVSLVSASIPVAAARGQSQAAPSDAEAARHALETLDKEIPRDTFDPQAIVNAVGQDRTALLGWVRDRTYWVPYRGALRGPTGVLLDRLGNSLDRSLLLAELLTLAGHTVRLAQTTLAEETARQAVGRVRAVPANPLPPYVEDDATIQRYAKMAGLDWQAARTLVRNETQALDEIKTNLGKRVAVQAPFLLGAIGARPPGDNAADGALEAMRDHWWVQQLNGEQWIDLDPTWPATRAVIGETSAEQTVDYDRPRGEIPLSSELTHAITIRVVVEQWKDGQLAEQAPLEHTFRPAETYGQPMVLQVAPIGLSKLSDLVMDADPARALRAALLRQKEWLPTLTVGERAIRQSSFTDSGEVNDNPGQAAAAASAFAAAVDPLGGGDSVGRLTAVWIEYEINVPGRSPAKARRDLVDLLDHRTRSMDTILDPRPDESKRAMRALSLASVVQLLPLTAKLSRAYAASQFVASLLRNNEALAGLVDRAAAADVSGMVSRSEALKPAMNMRLLELAVTRSEWSTSGQDVYLDSPNILSYRTALFQSTGTQLGARQGFDVVLNDVAVRPGVTGDPFAIRLSQGTTDTNLEDLLMRGGPNGSASSVLGANPQRASWVTLRSVDDPGWSTLSLPADVRGRIEDDLRRGYVVVVPRAAAVTAANGQIAWWRTDPRSGATIGMGRQGWGQSFAEYMTFWLATGSFMFALCTLVQIGPRQTPAQRSQVFLECACLGYGGGLALLVGLGGGGLGAFLVIATKAVGACLVIPRLKPPAPQPGSLGTSEPVSEQNPVCEVPRRAALVSPG